MSINPLEQIPTEENTLDSLDEAVLKLMGKGRFPDNFFNDQFGVWFKNLKKNNTDDQRILELLEKNFLNLGIIPGKQLEQNEDSDIEKFTDLIKNEIISTTDFKEGIKLIISTIFEEDNTIDIQSLIISQGRNYKEAVEGLKNNSDIELQNLIANIKQHIRMHNKYKKTA